MREHGLHSSVSGQGQAVGSVEHGKDPFFPQNARNFLTSWRHLSSSRALLHAVNDCKSTSHDSSYDGQP